ncbi:hypothetical protein C8R45DRAFT_931010 [Mycena sanguinolenta]|nr:hypothetical protein C8R45DRAFT_931010 [Mycena sanguinolenta]
MTRSKGSTSAAAQSTKIPDPVGEEDEDEGDKEEEMEHLVSAISFMNLPTLVKWDAEYLKNIVQSQRMKYCKNSNKEFIVYVVHKDRWKSLTVVQHQEVLTVLVVHRHPYLHDNKVLKFDEEGLEAFTHLD